MFDESAVLIVVLSLLGIAQDLPGLHDFVEFLLAGVAVRVFVRVIAGHESFVLVFELRVGGGA